MTANRAHASGFGGFGRGCKGGADRFLAGGVRACDVQGEFGFDGDTDVFADAKSDGAFERDRLSRFLGCNGDG